MSRTKAPFCSIWGRVSQCPSCLSDFGMKIRNLPLTIVPESQALESHGWSQSSRGPGSGPAKLGRTLETLSWGCRWRSWVPIISWGLGCLGAAEKEGMIGPLAVWNGRLPTYREGITAIFQKGEQGSFYQDRTAQLYSARTHTIQNQWIKNMSHYLWIVEPRKLWKYSILKTLALRNSINVRFSFIVSV